MLGMKRFFAIAILLAGSAHAFDFAFYERWNCAAPVNLSVHRHKVPFRKIIRDYLVNASFNELPSKRRFVFDAPNLLLIQYERRGTFDIGGANPWEDIFTSGQSVYGSLLNPNYTTIAWCYVTIDHWPDPPFQRPRNVSIIFSKYHDWTPDEIIRVLNIEVPIAQALLASYAIPPPR